MGMITDSPNSNLDLYPLRLGVFLLLGLFQNDDHDLCLLVYAVFYG
jgi:hypothetical protein